MTPAGVAFGRRLREAREQNGVTLGAVSESTKIKLSLLSGLERGDVSGWPRGIFRRAFVRGYATAIGLQPSAVLAEFSRLFPEDGEAHADGFESRGVDGGLRLTFAADEALIARATIVHLAAALLDLAAVVALSAAISYFTGAGLWLTVGVAGLIYYTVATAWVGRSAASWWLHRKRSAGTKRAGSPRRTRAIQADRFQIVSRRTSTRPRSLERDPKEASEVSPVVAARR